MAGKSKDELQAELRKRKMKTSGTKADLQRRLDESNSKQDALLEDEADVGTRRNESEAMSLPPGQALTTLMPTSMSSITKQCLDVLGVSMDCKVWSDAEVDADLQPVKILTTSIIECSKSMKLDPSPARNLQLLKMYVSRDLKRQSIEELSVKPEVAGLLSTFSEEEGTETPILAESGLAISYSTSTTLAREVRTFENGLRQFLRAWMTKFPEPEFAVWPEDFNAQEKEDVREFVRLFVIDGNRKLLQEDITEEVIEAVVYEIMADTEFPVAKGHTSAIIGQVVKLLRKEILISGRRKEKRKAKKAEEMMAPGQAGQEDADDEPPWKPVRTKMTAEVQGDGEETVAEPPRKRGRPKKVKIES